jgi:hypothetical protein
MPASDVKIFEAVAGGVLSALGYERRFPSPPMGLRVQGAFRGAAFATWTAGSRVKKVMSEAIGRSKPASIDRAVDGA